MSTTDSEIVVPNEFEREAVPEKARLGFKSFVGMYAGEHCAGTELMIGPLFIAAGVGAFDLLLGLFLGNLLAVLSWTFLTAPIATKSRLTLYYQLEKICGRNLVVLYNLANGVAFCFLAGAMVTVSATAFGVWFNFPMPGLGDMLPNSVGWVVATLAVGTAIAFVAAYGYQTVAKIANIAAPWMVLLFLSFGIIAFKELLTETQTTLSSPSQLWTFLSTQVWKGGDPLPGAVKFSFWHVMFFAWFCNMAMHIGMSDLSVFRYARKSWYGVATATGMYIGHFMAWIAASLLYALQLARDPSNTDVLPGPLAYSVAGVAGLLCVIVAGWTTANPTIYRAGLAFQAILPRVSRFKVTLFTGMIVAVIGLFPFIAMKLLGFVALYGLLLMPMGAIVVMDFYCMRPLGLSPFFAEKHGLRINWAAGITWAFTLLLCLWLVQSGKTEIYFVSLPGWFIASALYLGLSKVFQKNPTTI